MTTRLTCLFFFLFLGLLACQQTFEAQCNGSEECPIDHFCQLGKCVDLNADPFHTTGAPSTDDSAPAASTNKGDSDLPNGEATPEEAVADHPCPDAPMADAESVILNEFMANVPPGDEGDANQDGIRHFHDDEFVELVNIGDQVVDMTGLQLQNDGDERFTFPPYCLDPLHAVVVFGGLEEGADSPSGEGFDSLISETWFRYAQGGGRIVIEAADGSTLADHSYGSHPDGSLNRWPELQDSDFQAHRDLQDDQSLFSPGTCSDGRPFTTGCASPTPEPTPSNHSDAKP